MRVSGACLAAALVLAGCSASGGTQAPQSSLSEAGKAEVEYIGAAELASLMEQGKVVLVDVRTPAEFAEARLHGSLNAPLQTFDPASIPIEAERETILYCRSSGRSGSAATILAEHLQSKVRHLEGGILAWNEAGLPTIPKPSDED